MRVVVLGTGALGCLFAARLAAAAEVWLLGTWEEGIRAVRDHGIRIEDGGSRAVVAVHAAGDPAGVPPADLALVLVKSYQTERAASWAAQVLDVNGTAITLQNGLGNAELLAAAVGAQRTLVGATFEGATLLEPGLVRHSGAGTTYVGAAKGAAQAGEKVVGLLNAAGFSANLVDDIDLVLWSKLVINAAINPLAAIYRVTNGELLATGHRRALLARLAAEAATVASARGTRLMYDDVGAQVDSTCRATAANRASMLQDIERGRRTEIDSINGAIVAEGHRLGLPVPANEVICSLIHGMSPAPGQAAGETGGLRGFHSRGREKGEGDASPSDSG